MEIVVSNGTIAREANAAAATQNNVWVHYTGRWNAQGLRMFVDGAPSGSTTSAITAQTSAAHRVRIGCSFAPNCTSGGGVSGIVDEVRISQLARSGDWIRFDVAAMKDQVATFGPIEVR